MDPQCAPRLNGRLYYPEAGYSRRPSNNRHYICTLIIYNRSRRSPAATPAAHLTIGCRQLAVVHCHHVSPQIVDSPKCASTATDGTLVFPFANDRFRRHPRCLGLRIFSWRVGALLSLMDPPMADEEMLVTKGAAARFASVGLAALVHGGNVHLEGATGGKALCTLGTRTDLSAVAAPPYSRMQSSNVSCEGPPAVKQLAALGARALLQAGMLLASVGYGPRPLVKGLTASVNATHVRLVRQLGGRRRRIAMLPGQMAPQLLPSCKAELTLRTFVGMGLAVQPFVATQVVSEGKGLAAAPNAADKGPRGARVAGHPVALEMSLAQKVFLTPLHLADKRSSVGVRSQMLLQLARLGVGPSTLGPGAQKAIIPDRRRHPDQQGNILVRKKTRRVEGRSQKSSKYSEDQH